MAGGLEITRCPAGSSTNPKGARMGAGMRTIADLRVGDVVHISDVNQRGPMRSDVVRKVGTKLITVGRDVFRKDTGSTNDDCGHRRLVPDFEAYNEHQEAMRILQKIRGVYRAEGVSLANVKEAARLLGIEVSE